MIAIPKGHGRGTWRPVRGRQSARFTCPKCGLDAELDHSIDAGGVVSPSVQCPECDFHEHIRLAEWER